MAAQRERGKDDLINQIESSKKSKNEKASTSKPPPSTRFQSYTPLNTTRAQILNEIKKDYDLKRPPKLRAPPNKRKNNQYCRFHKDHSHDTEDCRQLKDAIEDLIQRGHLKKYTDSQNKPKSDGQSKGNSKNKGCFICDGPHRMKDCPKREKLSAIVAESSKDGDGDSESPTRVTPLQLLTAIQTDKTPTPRGLMYVKAFVNGREVKAMVDTGATHNFVAEREILNLRLELAQNSSRMKAVNSEAMPIRGLAAVDLKVGSWAGKCSLMAVPLDDFDVILGNEFLVAAKAAVMPYLGGLLIADEKSPAFVNAVYSDHSKKEGKQVGSCECACAVAQGRSAVA